MTSQEYTDDIPNCLRMEADLDLMRRAITKEFKSGGGQYVFGKAMDFAGWWEEQQAEQPSGSVSSAILTIQIQN